MDKKEEATTGKEEYGDVPTWMVSNILRQFTDSVLEFIDNPKKDVYRFYTGDFKTSKKINVTVIKSKEYVFILVVVGCIF